MRSHERLIVGSIFAVLIFGSFGFLVHVAPRFAGSGMGAVFGISGALLMLFPLAYVAVKRIAFFKQHLTRRVSMQTWMSVHVYTGIVGALLALIHSGHKYDSTLGIALTAAMMLAIVSGFAVRYLVPFVNLDMKDKLLLLQTARGDLDSAWGTAKNAVAERGVAPKLSLLTASLASLGLSASPTSQITVLAEGVAELEYSVRTDELLRRWFSRALTIHIVLSVALYALLAAHIASGIYFGLRWLP